MSEIANSVKGRVKKATDLIKQVLGVPKRVGLVLGGGGARGIAHIGVLKVLTENKIPIHLIAGTSSGALMGALFSGGMSPYDMAHIARNADWIKLLKFRFSKVGPVSGEGIEKLITDSMQTSVIEGLRIPLAIVATDIKTGEKVIIKEGSLARAVHASSAIPGVFSPVLFQGRLLCDGLMVDNVPVDVVRQMGADFIIAVDVIPNVVLGDWQPNAISLIERAIDITCRRTSGPQKHLADIVIDPVYKNISALSLKDAEILIKMGEEAALQAIPKIKDKLKIS